MASVRNLGVYHAMDDALLVLRADKCSSTPEVQSFLKIFAGILESKRQQPDGGVGENKHHFVVVEGPDGSGKTTVTKLLSKKLGGVRMSTPGPQFLQFRPFFDMQSNHLRRAYYSLTNYAAAAEIREQLKKQPVVLDRFWHSTTAYALASQIQSTDELPIFGDPIYKWPSDLQPFPDVVFFLKVSEVSRLKRITQRDTVTEEEIRLAKEAGYREVLHEAYQRMFNPKITEVDANCYPKQVVMNILQVLGKE